MSAGTVERVNIRNIEDDKVFENGDSDTSLIIGDSDDSDDENIEVIVSGQPIRATSHDLPKDSNIPKADCKFCQEDWFQERLNVKFRRIKNDKLVFLEEHFPLVDMQVDGDIEERMIRGEELTDVYKDKRAVTFIWSDLNTSSPLTLSRLYFKPLNIDTSFYCKLYLEMVRDDFAVCRDFVSKVYKNFRSNVVCIVPGNISFEVLHNNFISFGSTREHCESDGVIVDFFKELLVNCTNMAVEVELEVETVGNVTEWQELMEEESRKSLQKLKLSEQKQERYLSNLGTGSAERKSDSERNSGCDELVLIDELEAEQISQNNLLDNIHEMLSTHTQGTVVLGEERLPDETMASSVDTAALFASQQWASTVMGQETKPSNVDQEFEFLAETMDQKQTRQTRQKQSSFQASLQTSPKVIYPHYESRDKHLLKTSDYLSPTPSMQTVTSLPESQDNMFKMIEAVGLSDGATMQRFSRAFEKNLIDEDPVPPRADSHDTILCLDISQSMEGQAFVDMKRMALKFVDGVEEIAESYDLEENLAVVTISDYANVKQHLTNDYSRIRNVIDTLVPHGRTPFFEAIIVCLAALSNGKGRIVNVQGIHQIRPQILFFTDGKPTDESQITGQDIERGRMMHRLPIIKLVTEIGTKDQNANPIVWIPVGEADKDFLKSLSSLGNGTMASEEDIPKLCSYYRIQDGIGRVFSCVRHDRERYTNDSFSIEAITEGLVPNLSAEEKKGIADAVIEKLKTQKTEKKPDDFDDIHEDVSSFPPLGSRVVRGPDWKWQNQDTEGAGTIINHNTLDKWLWVKWDNGEQNVYRYGENGAYDVLVVDDHPLLPEPGSIPIGVTVTRGPDWCYGNDDGGPGCLGVVIRKKGRTQVKVRWDSGSIKSYKYGENGIYELTVCDPYLKLPQGSVPDCLLGTPMSLTTGTLRSKTNEKMVWQWQDEQLQWRLYPEADQVKIDQTYQRKKTGSCVVSRRGENYRVLLGQLIERSIDGDSRHKIRHIEMSDEDFRIEKATEAFISM